LPSATNTTVETPRIADEREARIDVTMNDCTLARVPAEDVVLLPSGTAWQVPWELFMLGPFVGCGLLDGRVIRHVTVSAMVQSAVRRGTAPTAALVPADYVVLPVFAARMTVLDAALLVVDTGWELAVVMDDEPKVITARSVYRAVLGSAADSWSPAGSDPWVEELTSAPRP
jgi:hypothetical protein